jgi:peptide/nickel transport system permease protein
VTLPFAQPTSEFPLGGDALGRDVLSRVLGGGRELVLEAFAATIIGVLLGAILGLTAAYARGAIDVGLMRFSDVLLAFPTIILALLFVSMLGASPWLLVAIVAISHVPSVARVIRGAAIPIVQNEHVLWARAVGIPAWKIVGREIAPLVTSPLMVEFGLRLMWSVGALASLSFLGYGTQAPAADWGLMVSENRNALTFQPYPVVVPILMIAIFTVGGTLVSEGIARALGRTEGTRS